MAYAAIMVTVEPTAASESRTLLAHGLADRFDAALIGIAAQAPITAFAYDGAMPQAELIEYEFRRVAAELAESERRFHSVLPAQSRNRVEWRSFQEHPSRAVPREARSADLLIVGRGGVVDAGDLLMGAGRPVLVVPPGTSTLDARQVVVGWRDAAPARRAVADALPLLRRAEGVLVLSVTERSDEDQAEAEAATRSVVAYLARHGVAAAASVQAKQGGTVAEQLMLAARERGAGLIVSGGYGHARALEWAFGGVTRELLTGCPVPSLFSH
jgi:nucleotide-binding universal stress UspA family protein